MKILLADEDQDFVELTSFALRRHGHHVITAINGAGAIERSLIDSPDLVLLNVTLADGNGTEFCRWIRESSSVPIMLLSPHGDEDALMRGYESGADDYVVKPFSPRQLLLRIEVLMRRAGQGRAADTADEHRRVCAGDLVLDPQAFEVRKAGIRLPLTKIEFRIVSLLMRCAGRLVHSRRLAEYAWSNELESYPPLLKTHVSRIRLKLDNAGGDPIHIRAISRQGYILSAEPASAADPTPCLPHDSRLATPVGSATASRG